MNAAPALTREHDVQTKIRKVSAFGRYARVICSALFGFGLVGSALMFLLSVLRALGVIDPGVSLAPDQQMWALPMTGIFMGVWLAVVYQLYRLFGNLAAGAIFTPENVRRVRVVGFLWMLLAVLGVTMLLARNALVASGVVALTDSPQLDRWFSWSDSLNGFASAGLVLLISWIMDIGLYEKDQAAALQRDAELVI